jgi:hypothetical protein
MIPVDCPISGSMAQFRIIFGVPIPFIPKFRQYFQTRPQIGFTLDHLPLPEIRARFPIRRFSIHLRSCRLHFRLRRVASSRRRALR